MRNLLILLFVPFALYSQDRGFPEGGDFYFDRLDREDGLSHPSVSAIVQDSRGFLWIGTQDGLSRYDGREFLTFEHKPFRDQGLPNSQIQSLFMGEGDILWVGTYGGLSRFDIVNLTFTNYSNDPEDPASLLGTIVTAAAEGEEGVWVGTLGGLCLLDEERGRFTRFVNSESDGASLPDNNVRALFYDDNNRLWIGTNKGLSLYLGDGKFRSWPMGEEGTEPTDAKAVMSIKETETGELAAGLWAGGVLLFDREKETVSRRYLLPDNRIYFVYPDGESLWAGTWGGGLYHIDREEGDYIHLEGTGGKGELDGDIMYSFCRDDKGTYWIGTKGEGLFKLNPKKMKALIYTHDPTDPYSLGSGEITEMLFDKNETLWVGTYSNGLYRQEGKENHFTRYGMDEPYPFTLNVDRITMLHKDEKERVWLGTTRGLLLYNEETEAFEPVLFDDRYEQEDQNIVYSMAEDREGNYWIGTYNRGVVVRDRNWENPRYYDSSEEGKLSDNLVADIICDSAGDIWLATNGGVNRYVGEEDDFIHYRYNKKTPWGINTDHVRHLFEDSHHYLWVGTSEGGLNRLERKIGTPSDLADESLESWLKYTKQNGLPHNHIMKIQEDGRGNLWISTSFGMALFSRQEGTFTTIPREEGLFSPEFSNGAAVDSRGNLYFGSNDGVNLFSLETQYGNIDEPRVVITDVQVYRRSLYTEGTIYNDMSLTLSYEERYLEIAFSVLDLISSGNNRFAYRLDGMDKDWNYGGEKTSVVYNNLSPGRYTFRVKGANSGGIWSSEEAVLHLTINPPPWRSPGAIIIYISGGLVFAILLFLSILHRFSLQKIRELEEVKQQLVEANNQLIILSGQDGLTGVNNRRQFDVMIREAWDVHQRTKQSMAFLMMDIDFFKAYNDSYGHQQGDTCLVALARLFQEALPRSTDRVFRYGGEEFCILLPGTDREGAILVAERIHEI
ncbi:MAG: two-component regulator propeller domain-containing protein, partial [Spirochaetales bacterium]|nr:two-component regulator propeller domain-containing protein [Spirochaetales bacterium]